MSRDEIKRSRKREERSGAGVENLATGSKEKDSDDSDKGHEIENEDSEEENEEQNAGTPRNRKENPNGKKRGRPKGSVSKKKKTDEEDGKEKRGRKIKGFLAYFMYINILGSFFFTYEIFFNFFVAAE